ncbi:MAG TPA: thioredoxin domain-containing protein [Polyangiaceae bacterium]|nr:thioredoxin domain-containing protein [Polyangiaceae bacterium]
MKLRNAILLSSLLAVACSDSGNKVGPDSASGSAAASASGAPATPTGDKAVGMLDVKGLTDREKVDVSGALGELFAPCSDTPVSLAQCIAEDRACKACKPAGEFVARAVRTGKDRKAIKELFTARFDPKAVAEIDLGSAPTEGPADAPVTIVEWADFECPFCGQMKMILQLLQERFPGQIRFAYKFYALPAHAHAFDAAKAGVAALNQGKFWEMHKMLFENQEHLESTDLLKYAKKLDLDMAQFRKDYASDATEERIKEDMRRADDLKLDGTPMIYINGRRLPSDQLDPFLPELIRWVQLDIETAGKVPAAPSEKFSEMMKELGIDEAILNPGGAPAPSASAAPDASAAPSASAGASASAGPAASAAPSAKPAASAAPSAH